MVSATFTAPSGEVVSVDDLSDEQLLEILGHRNNDDWWYALSPEDAAYAALDEYEDAAIEATENCLDGEQDLGRIFWLKAVLTVLRMLPPAPASDPDY